MYFDAMDHWSQMSEHARTLERELSALQARADEAELNFQNEIAVSESNRKLVEALQSRVGELKLTLRDIRDRIVTGTAGTTHYEGCEANHRNCALLKLIDRAIAEDSRG
jgi:Mg2+ and Co2+ transporter CorA